MYYYLLHNRASITGRGPIIANLHITHDSMQIFWPFFADDNNKWWQSRQQNPTFVSWLIQKKSGKIPLETIPLYINLTGGHVNGGAVMPVAIVNRKKIADWCSNDRKTLVTPSFFVVRQFLFNFTVDLYIYFPTSNKMAIIGTLPSRFSDKNQQLYKGSLILALPNLARWRARHIYQKSWDVPRGTPLTFTA